MRVRTFFFPFIIVLISLAVYQVTRHLYSPHWQELTDTSFGILSGTPAWRAYQNRLLGPLLVSLISTLGISQVSALKVFVLLAITAQNLLLGLLLRGSKAPHILLVVLSYSLLFLFVQEFSFYPWDFVDVFLFTLFAWGIFKRKSLLFFVVLFCVSIFNRESALFISLYLFIDAFEINRKVTLASREKLITGFVLTLAGILYIVAVRELLFVSQPGGFLDSKHAWFGNHINVEKNLFALFIGNFLGPKILNSIFLLGSLGYVFWFVKQQWKAVLLYLVMVLNILIFGLVNESRLYGILLPFLVFFALHAATMDEATPETQPS